MEKILFVNACMRDNSRTLEIAKSVIAELSGEVKEIDLGLEKPVPLDKELLLKREELAQRNDFSDGMFRYAEEFAAADIILIAAPYWDLMFPAILKIYLEQITVCGITFRYSDGKPEGLCKAKRLIYVTTAGGEIQFDFGFEYVKTLAENFYGIREVKLFKAENLDIDGADVRGIIDAAKRKAHKDLKKRRVQHEI